MTKEEKQLLLKDLCPRLPYGVNVFIEDGQYNDSYSVKLTVNSDILRSFNKDESGKLVVKPYLRPMSSMTEEEQNEFDHLKFRHDEEGWLDFVLSRHLDWRGLIEKGLALEASEGMYKTE